MIAEIQALRAALPQLQGRDIEFATSLLDQHTRKGQLSPKQMFWIDKLIERANGEQPQRQTAEIGDMSGILAIFDRALAKMKKPEVVIQLPGHSSPIAINVASARSKAPGTLNVIDMPTNTWFGRIQRNGTFESAYRQETPAGVIDGLKAFAQDPFTLAASHGRNTGRCCFCGIGLTDPKSKAAGMGETCARNWGLHDHYKAALTALAAQDPDLAAVLGARKTSRKRAA